MDRASRVSRGRCAERYAWWTDRRTSAVAIGALLVLWSLPASPLFAQGITACQSAAAPGAAFSVTCSSLTCTFTVTSPLPASGDFAWDFGDGMTADGPQSSVNYAYGTTGSYVVTLTVTDVNGLVGVATGTLTLGSSLPLAVDDAFVTDMGTPLTIGIDELLANDAPGVTFIQTNPSWKCNVAPGATSCTYTPASIGTDTFTYSVRDMLGNTGTATVTITVRPMLVANPDFFTVSAGGTIPISSSQLLANDSPNAVFISAQDAVNGSLSLVTAGPPAAYSFTAAPGFVGDAGFDYLISWDGNPPYERGIVTVTVIDSPPTASFTVSCVNRMCTVHTTSTDPDSTQVSRWLWNWGDGSPTVEPTNPYRWADQTYTYAHSGRYTITHTVYDTAGLSGSLQLAVLANTAPVAVNDTATTSRDLPKIIYVLANDSDPDGDPLSIFSVNMQNYPGASWQVVPSGSSWALMVTPPDNFVGTMTFIYVAADPLGATATATVTLTVNQTAHVLNAADQQFWCQQNGSLRIPKASLLAVAYDSTPGVTLAIFGFDKSVLAGTLDCATDPTACTFTPPTNAYGVTLFRYTVGEVAPAAGYQDTGTVRIYVGTYGQAPTANDVNFTTTRNTPKVFTIQDVVQNDGDPDGDSLSMALQSGPTAYGSLSCSTPMYTCTYTPNPGFVGTDRFLYSASDGIFPPVTATINILTLPPTTATFDAREDVIVTGVNQSATFTNGLLSNDYLPNGGPETVTALDTTGLIGTLSCNATSCTYTPPNSFSGTTTFKYTANDGHGATDTAIVKVKVGVTNHSPVAVAQTLSTPKNTALQFSVFDLMRNDYDPDNDPLSVTVYTVTAHLGTLACGTPNYWCVYTPNANTTGADAITYLLSDGTTSVTSTVTINITP